MSIQEIWPVFELIDKWQREGYVRDRQAPTPLAEVALNLINLAGWWDANPKAVEGFNVSLWQLIGITYREDWVDIEAVAGRNFEAIVTTEQGAARNSDNVICATVASTLAAVKCALRGDTARAWSYAIDSRMLCLMVLQSWNVRQYVLSAVATERADARWGRLDKAKALAFMRRREFPKLSRSAAIDRFLPELLDACREAGAPLTGGDPKATVTKWFRDAGIK